MDMRGRIVAFLETRFRASLAGHRLEADTSLFSNGIVDSFGVLELISFLEETFGIAIDPGRHELSELDTVEKIAMLVEALGRTPGRP